MEQVGISDQHRNTDCLFVSKAPLMTQVMLAIEIPMVRSEDDERLVQFSLLLERFQNLAQTLVNSLGHPKPVEDGFIIDQRFEPKRLYAGDFLLQRRLVMRQVGIVSATRR